VHNSKHSTPYNLSLVQSSLIIGKKKELNEFLMILVSCIHCYRTTWIKSKVYYCKLNLQLGQCQCGINNFKLRIPCTTVSSLLNYDCTPRSYTNVMYSTNDVCMHNIIINAAKQQQFPLEQSKLEDFLSLARIAAPPGGMCSI
jgi:hypothetical protein